MEECKRDKIYTDSVAYAYIHSLKQKKKNLIFSYGNPLYHFSLTARKETLTKDLCGALNQVVDVINYVFSSIKRQSLNTISKI